MWIEFVVGSRPCSERFSPGYSGFPLFSKTNISKFQFDLDYCQALQYHEPLAREIAQTLPVLLTLSKLHYFTIIHVNVTGYRKEKNVSEIIETPFKTRPCFGNFGVRNIQKIISR